MRPVRWIIDPVVRHVTSAALAVAMAVLVVLAAVAYVTSYDQARSALHTRDDSAARATARITDLTGQIRGLEDSANNNSGRIGELIAEVHALEAQVTAMGGRPVVSEPTVTPTGTTTTVPVASTRPAPSTSSTTSPPPPPPPSTTTTTVPPTCTSLPVVGCVGAKASRSATRTDCGDWLDLIGGYDWQVPTACRVMMCESGGDPNAVNRSSNARGLFQILGGPLDAAENVALAYQMWQDRGWQPWVCK